MLEGLLDTWTQLLQKYCSIPYHIKTITHLLQCCDTVFYNVEIFSSLNAGVKLGWSLPAPNLWFGLHHLQ